MIKKVILFIALFVGVFLISINAVERRRSDREEPIYCTYLGELLTPYLEKLFLEYGMRCTGYGGALMTEVEEVDLSFSAQYDFQIDEARQLIVFCVDDLLHTINNDQKIRPYLIQYPFEAKNLNFNIGFMDKDDSRFFVDSCYIACVTILNGNVLYSVESDDKTHLITVYKETYEEARAKTQITTFPPL